MAKKLHISLDQLSQLIRYDPENGLLYWRARPPEMFARSGDEARWNRRYADKEALGCVHTNGYKRGNVMSEHYGAHRICWALYHGEWPDLDIDHVNGIRTDNRIANLRHVSRLENGRNQKIPFDNTSGKMGVSFRKDTGVWDVKITNNGIVIHLGCYEDFRIACAVRHGAEKALGFHENHGRV
jgi:hypothetical protein